MHALERISHWSPLGDLQDLAAAGRRRQVPAGKVLLSQAGAASHAALIIDGTVKVSMQADGHKTLLAICGPGELVGADAALMGPSNGTVVDAPKTTVTALTAVTAAVFPVSELEDFIQDNPAGALAVIRSLCERLTDAQARIFSAAHDGADRRLARFLCDLERYGIPIEHSAADAVRLPIPLSHADFAAWIGTCRETVDRTLRRWRRRSIVFTKYRDIRIYDRQTLARIAGVQVFPTRQRGTSEVPRGPAGKRGPVPARGW